MKTYIALLILVIVLMLLALSKAEGGETIEQTIREVAQDYRQEQNFQNKCTILDQEVSLGALVYAMARQEGGTKEGTVGYKTNNPGSLRKSQGLKTPTGTITADNSNSRITYATMYDGLYEMAHLLVGPYGCSINVADAMCYIYGCKAERTDDRVSHATAYTNNLLSHARQFDSMKGYHIAEPSKKVEGCVQIGRTEADRIQFDTSEGEFISSHSLPKGLVKVFKCFE